MNPHVSIIIPCYNQASLLPDAINSVIAQTLINWECIIVNDGSTDNTADVSEKLAQTDARIRVINQKNIGLSGARNSGLKAANGEFLQFLDADDMLEPGKLKAHLTFLHENRDIDIVFGDARYFTTENPELREFGINKKKSWIPEIWFSQGNPIEKFLNQNLFPVNCPLIRTTVFDIVGQWNVDLEAHEDWEFWLRCVATNIKIAYYQGPNCFALVRMHPQSMSNDNLRMKRTNVKMRIVIGHLLKTSGLRIINFKKGLCQLHSFNAPNIAKQALKLCRANISIKVLLSTLQFLYNFYVTKNIIKLYRKNIPWPVQKFLLKIFRIS